MNKKKVPKGPARRSKESYEKAPGRPKDQVIVERTNAMMDVISNRPNVHRFDLHKLFVPLWRVSWRTVDRVLERAQKELMIRLKRDREEFRSESLAFYEAKINDPKSSIRDQIRARRRIDELLGLDAPKRQEISGIDGSPLVPSLSPEFERALNLVYGDNSPNSRLASTNGNGHSNGS